MQIPHNVAKDQQEQQRKQFGSMISCPFLSPLQSTGSIEGSPSPPLLSNGSSAGGSSNGVSSTGSAISINSLSNGHQAHLTAVGPNGQAALAIISTGGSGGGNGLGHGGGGSGNVSTSIKYGTLVPNRVFVGGIRYTTSRRHIGYHIWLHFDTFFLSAPLPPRLTCTSSSLPLATSRPPRSSRIAEAAPKATDSSLLKLKKRPKSCRLR